MISNVTRGKVLDDLLNDTNECDAGRVCANESKPVSPIAMWTNQVSHYNFPCPLRSHDHEIAGCPEFLILSPKDRWYKIPRARICYTCTEEESVPLALKCAVCTPWAAAKGWAAFNILFCRKLEHGVGRPGITKVRLALE